VRIARVFTPGNRAAVIAKAQAHDFAARRAFFLIDGDLDWVRGEPAPFPDLVYRLDAYCVENLLIHEDAAVKFLIEEAVLSEAAAIQALQFDHWLKGVSSSLLDLFAWFAVLNLVKPSEPTVSLGIGMLLAKPGKGVPKAVDPSKVLTLVSDVRKKAEIATSKKDAAALQSAILNRIKKLPIPSDAISGKDYLFPLFEYHLWRSVTRQTSRKSLRVRFARNCCLERFKLMSEALLRSLK
jgi:hypothetical protein